MCLKFRKEIEEDEEEDKEQSTNSPLPEVPKEEKRSTNFRLLELPDVARIKVIRSMDALEQIKFALSSKRMEGYMKMANNKKSKGCKVHFTGLKSYIATSPGPFLYCGNPDKMNTGGINQELKPWINENLTDLENIINVFERYRNTFPFEKFSLVIHPNSSVNVKAILETSIYKKCYLVVFKEDQLEPDDLEAVMDTAHDGIGIDFVNQEFPLDYDHKNAFKFNFTYYDDARWVRLRHLLSLHNHIRVKLFNHSLGSEDLNAFLKFWVKSDHDMTRIMSIYLWKSIESSVLFKELVVLRIFRFGHTSWLLAADPTKSKRKHPIMSVWWDGMAIVFDTWHLNETFNEGLMVDHVGGVTLAKEYQILRILNEKKDMEEKLKGGDSDERRAEIEESIRKCEKELDANDVYYDEGIPVVD
uniref:FBA_2 domain-containing protein n=1 Tax=Caenorhabditis tropicalis TaxID=1561998 RepID=A0A1I7T3N7_9PELO